MKKVLKISIALIILLVISVGVVIWNLNPIINSLKPNITDQISKTIQQPVNVGEIKIKLFPNVAVELHDLTLENEDGAAKAASLKVLSLRTRLMPLITKRELSVSKLVLKGAELNVKRHNDGTIYLGKVQVYPPKKVAQAQPDSQVRFLRASAEAEDNSASAQPSSEKVAFEIEDAEIEDFNIHWHDEKVTPAIKLSVKDIDADISNLSKTELAKFSVTATAFSKSKQNFSLEGTGRAPSGGANLPESDITLNADNLELSDLIKVATAYGVKIEHLNIGNTASVALKLKVDKSGIVAQPSLNASSSSIAFAKQFKKSSGKTLKLDATLKPGMLGAVQGEQVDLQIGSNTISLPFSFAPTAPLSIKVISESIDLSDLAQFLPSLDNFELVGHTVPKLDVTLPAKGNAGHPLINGNLQLKNLNLTNKVTPNSKANIKDLNLTAEIRNNTLNTKDLNVTLADLKINGDLTAQIFEDANKTRSIKSNLALFEGKLALESKIRKQKDIGINLNLSSMNLESISSFALSDSSITVTGSLNSLDSNINLNTDNPTQTLRGPLTMKAENGEIKGFNVLARVLEKLEQIPALAQASAKNIPEKYQEIIRADDTAFDEINLEANIQTGNIQLDNFELVNELYTLAGQGNISFLGTIDLNTQLKINSEITEELMLKEPKIELLADQEGRIVIPVVIRKTGKVPIVLPDFSQLTKRAARNTAKEAGKRALEKVAPGLEGAVDVLDGLFK